MVCVSQACRAKKNGNNVIYNSTRYKDIFRSSRRVLVWLQVEAATRSWVGLASAAGAQGFHVTAAVQIHDEHQVAAQASPAETPMR